MSQKDYEKGWRDGMNGIYQPPHQKVFGPRSTCTPKEIEKDRDDYRLGHMLASQKKMEKESLQRPLPLQGTQSENYGPAVAADCDTTSEGWPEPL